MASTFNRGSRERPKWFARWRDQDGVWRSKLTHQPTRALAFKVALELQARAERQRLGLEKEIVTSPLVGPLMERWSMGLTNRSSRDDMGRLRLHMKPRFAALRMEALTLGELMRWLDEERTAARISPATLRHCLNLVSRFFGWAIERGYATSNPVRMIPPGRRPQAPGKRDVPWISDEAVIVRIMESLPDPFRLMFFIGNRCGARLGECCGVRLGDVATLVQGCIRLRYSYAGPLKEDRRGVGKTKWAPAPADAQEMVGPWVARRRAEGAGDEDFLFVRPGGGHYRKEAVEAAWNRVRASLGLACNWYQATRHSAASRWLSLGVPLDQVAAALGHSTPAVTAKHYAHFVRRSFSAGMLAPLERPPSSPAAAPAPELAPSPQILEAA